jgi:putative ABC transport system permease protein
LTTTLVGLCGLIALAMSSIGVYGVMADAVRRRTREIGLRMALGASRMRVMRLVFSEVLYLATAGLLAGTAATVVSTYLARSFVYGVPSLDLANFAAAAAALASVVGIASVLPLRRALGVNPNIALRAE